MEQRKAIPRDQQQEHPGGKRCKTIPSTNQAQQPLGFDKVDAASGKERENLGSLGRHDPPS